MTHKVDSKGVRAWVKIYERLLETYPAGFRREYGPAMEQLFRDQCRDAWSEGRGWGLAGLWLRVVPDLGKTLFVEHLASLNQKDFPLTRILRTFRADPRLRATFLKVFVMVFMCALGWSAFMTYTTPRIYFSTVGLKVTKEAREGGEPLLPKQRWDPYFVAMQFRIVTSRAMLRQVITGMNLQHVLASQAGEPDWPLDKTCRKLEQEVVVTQTLGTSVLEISVKNPDPNEAAKIANAIADTYQSSAADIHLHPGEQNPTSVSVTIRQPARPDLHSIARSKTAIFSNWFFGGTLLALVAGGGGAWLAFLIQRKDKAIKL